MPMTAACLQNRSELTLVLATQIPFFNILGLLGEVLDKTHRRFLKETLNGCERPQAQAGSRLGPGRSPPPQPGWGPPPDYL